jgi:uncharacterized protein (TIGR02677 family)
MLERAVALLPLREPENLAVRADQEESLSPETAEQAATQTSTHNLITAFKPFGPITLFNYLTPISDRIDWYRAIMRIFLQRSREYRYQLTAQDVLDTLHVSQARGEQEYFLETCKNDLARLVSWGNLTTLYDTSRVTTITDFRSPVLLYQSTQEALAIENFLAEQARIGASEGGLYQGDLPRIWDALQQLDGWLRQDRTTLTSERSQEIAEQWRIAFTTWERVTNDAAQYLGSMNRSSQQAINIETFLAYKNIVVLYVQSFAQQLVDYSNTIRMLFADWSQHEIQVLLLDIVASTPPPLQSLAENQALWREDVTRQIEALEQWFTREINVSMFLKAAHDAVEKVVQRAHLLATSMRPQTDYVTMLHKLANELLLVEDFETAQTLFTASFANSLPIHLAEGFTGTPVVAERSRSRPTWQAEPTVTRNMRALYRGAIERNMEPPMRRNEADLLALKQKYEADLQAQRQRFERLFQTPLLDMGTLQAITPDERRLLITIIDSCLNSPTHEYILPDGATATLLNPDEQHYTSLKARDGILTLPRYRLQIHRSVQTEAMLVEV